MTPAARSTAAALAGLLCLAAAARPCRARVFTRWSAAARSDRVLESIGGEKAYSAPITLNGGDGEFALFSYRDALPAVIEQLREALPGLAVTYQGGSLAYADLTTGPTVLRCVAVRLTSEGRTLVFKVAQSREDYAASRRPDPNATLADLPAIPGAAVFIAADLRRNLQFGVWQAAGGADDNRNRVHAALRAAGWAPTLAREQTAPVSGLGVYLRRDALCCVFVDDADGRGARITILHKQQTQTTVP